MSAIPNIFLRPVLQVAGLWGFVCLAVAVWLYPYEVGQPPQQHQISAQAPSQTFYDRAYSPVENTIGYASMANQAARHFRIPERIQNFVQRYHLENARVLEVGAGNGMLQDAVQNYTGLDYSATAAQYFHKPFVQADARAMPFADNSFDAIWSIWVLEHIPDPERALNEMRRVIKPGGLLFLSVSWYCSPLAAEGYHARSFSDLSAKGALIKTAGLVAESDPFIGPALPITRGARKVTGLFIGDQGRLRYRPLNANYNKYWEPDSDAVNNLDPYETYQWFERQGDMCLNCSPLMFWDMKRDNRELIFRKSPK